MLDKSIPYKEIIMKLDKDILPTVDMPALPSGFAFKFFECGDEKYWAEIETSVLEFATEKDALSYFTSTYMPRSEDLRSRCVFIINEEKQPVATATAWFDDSDVGRHLILHWVAVRPEFQGLGLGKAVVQRVLKIFVEKDKECDVFLHTQTWSHKAVRIYHKLGFVIMKKETINNYLNEYDDAVEVLKSVIDPETYRSLIDTAV